MASKWSGILGSALKGAAEVAVPAALAKTADERRARLQQLRDQALFAQQRSMAAQEYAFRGAEGEANRGLQRDLGERGLAQGERRIGLIEAQMGQQADQFGQEFGLNQQRHADDVRLEEERLELLGRSGGATQGKEAELIMLFQDQGRSFDQAVEETKDILGRTDNLERTLLIETIKGHRSNPVTSMEPLDIESAVSEAKRAAKLMRSDAPAAEGATYTRDNPAQPTTQEEFDALPSGTIFLDPEDGKLYRKP